MLLSGSLLGCATPDYLLPGGYSSTYQKALIQGTPQPPVIITPPQTPTYHPERRRR